MDIRNAAVSRVTGETQIEIKICLDGTGKCEAATGIGFFDHMLNSFARHGLFDLSVNVQGDLDVDSHHTIEDTGIVLGEAIRQALGSKKGIKRFGSFILPMDETLVAVPKVKILLSQHIGAPAQAIVKAGDEVTRGQMIAKPADGLSVGIHASICGKVTEVTDRYIIIAAK